MAALLLLFGANAALGATSGFLSQMLTLPGSAFASRFVRLGDDGRSALLAVDVVGQRLFIYRQHATGFPNAPDQVLQLPPLTAWIAPCEVDAQPGLELLVSTASGLVYFPQRGGAFESEPRTLVKAAQVFTNAEAPALASVPTNAGIPVVSATEAVLYRRDSAFQWSRGESLPLELQDTRLRTWNERWSVGANSSRSLRIRQSFLAKAKENEELLNASIRQSIQELNKAGPQHPVSTNYLDLNRDGRSDFIAWQTVGQMNIRTDIYVFLRGADGRLPDRPTQILHCRGIPIPVGSPNELSPVGALTGDGACQLVLLELKRTFTSGSDFLDTFLSQGLQWRLTVRPFANGQFSRSPEASVSLTGLLANERMGYWPYFLCGDFNGDGRLDMVVQRSRTQWNILLSTKDGRWFNPEPGMTFETPMKGQFEVSDLNGDGRSDIVLRAEEGPRMFICWTQPHLR